MGPSLFGNERNGVQQLVVFPHCFRQNCVVISPALVQKKQLIHGHHAIAILGYLLSRFLLIHLNEAEFTDGYQLVTWQMDHPVRWHPLYPLLVKSVSWCIDPILAGRLVSVVTGLAAMITLAKIAERIYDRQASLMICWLYIVSPLIFWINLRVLTESTFQFFVCLAAYFFLLYWKDKKLFAGPTFVFLSGLAFLTRPEGAVFLPLVAYLVLDQIRRRQFRSAIVSILALTPWLLFIVWNNAIGPSDSYSSILGERIATFQWDQALTFFFSYIDLYAYVMVYPLFVFALLLLFHGFTGNGWKWLLFYFHGAFAFILFVHGSWTTRFLLIPITFMLVEAATFLANLRRPVQVCVMTGCLVISVTTIFLQKEMFADFKYAGIALRGKYVSHRIISDEQTKTSYYLGRDILVYKQTPVLQSGDVVILHSFITDLQREKKTLDQKYRYRPLHSFRSSLVPVLGNVALSDLHRTNSPLAIIERFQRQHFQSVILLIE